MLYELSLYEAMTLQAACVVAQRLAVENAKAFERCANNQHLPKAERSSAARMAQWYHARASTFENASETLDWGREITTMAHAKEVLER